MPKPRVTTNCVANRYSARNERIIEFKDDETDKGGLISIRRMDDGTLVVDVYRCDPGVKVLGPDRPVAAH
jgi:hypothetical protein